MSNLSTNIVMKKVESFCFHGTSECYYLSYCEGTQFPQEVAFQNVRLVFSPIQNSNRNKNMGVVGVFWFHFLDIPLSRIKHKCKSLNTQEVIF